ncbi:uncharacterized protein VICG_00530 [Vittaforma corneae ATCC 50505]|uniref:sn-1-specific diacylglycerol lipase n=1 Tax=Vittaforma corneae (strain ATCC 50505) TaxID=993615 RepID=L2GNL5_VITCO|nr:uncharacterized protein VICG_00530 [Vittaforma corneae ATCC 50505]ELA42431.1 hypothetical protein VICG_00530 [Vittaforma corneae ATCC 50505]
MSVQKISSDGVDFDTTEYLYKGKSVKFDQAFKVGVKTLNDLVFGTLYIIILKKYRNFLGISTSTKVAGIAIRLKHLIESKTGEQTFDIVPIIDLLSADYYDKNPPFLGRITIKFNIEYLNTPLEEEKNTSLTKKIINKIFSAEITESFEAINDISSFLSNGSTVCNLKSVAGMFIIDGLLIRKMECYEENHLGMNGCSKNNCLKSYTTISGDESKSAIKCINYCLAAYLDSKVWLLLIKPDLKRPNIKDRKLRVALERLKIPEEKFIKYHEGSHKLVGFIVFIDDDTLVVSFRGTLSHNDIINDLDACYTQFFNGYAHSGILKLANMFVDVELGNIKQIITENKLKKVLFTGHSLGGAVATVIHLIVTKNNFITACEIKTAAFASPPTVSESFLDQKIENLITYNYGNDIIPRLSLGSLLDFKFLCLSVANIFTVFSKSERSIEKVVEVHRYLKESDLYPKLYHPGTVYHIKAEYKDNKTTYGFKKVDPKFFANLIIYKDYPADHILKRHISAFNFCVENDENSSAVAK